MTEARDATQRRVYVLPTELVDRIVQYQNDMKFPSEVEAVRRLLDDALQLREDWKSLTRRYLEKLARSGDMAAIAKDLLVGHPIVKNISFGDNTLGFTTTSGVVVTIISDGTYVAFTKEGKELSSTEALPV
jgi:Arc/MetJ-type ribon-helix-helix transcriptional regulator